MILNSSKVQVNGQHVRHVEIFAQNKGENNASNIQIYENLKKISLNPYYCPILFGNIPNPCLTGNSLSHYRVSAAVGHHVKDICPEFRYLILGSCCVIHSLA